MVLLARIDDSSRMRRTGVRRIGAALAAGVVMVGVLGASAGASADTTAGTSGVGTSKVSTTVVGVQLGADGSLLNLRLLGDDASSTIDTKVSAPTAFSRLTPLTVASNVAALAGPLATLSSAVPAAESRTPGGQPSVAIPGLDLATVVPPTAGGPALATGALLPGTLTSALDDAGARSGLSAQLAKLALAGGLVSAQSAASNVTTAASSTVANATRSVKVDAVSVLDLGALLNALGIDLAKLPVPTVGGLLDQLGGAVPGLPTGQAKATLAALSSSITDVQGAIDNGANQVTTQLNSALSTVLTPVGLTAQVPPVNTPIDTALNSVKALLAGDLAGALAFLNDASLLKLDGAEIAVTSKAADTLANSAADITASLGGVEVGGIKLFGGLDLGAALTQINSDVNMVNQKLHDVLGTISPDLANLVSVSVLDQTKSVAADGGYNRARAGITALTANLDLSKLTAPLAQIVAAANPATGTIAAQLQSLGGTVPALDPAMATLNTALSDPGGALAAAGTANVVVGQVLSASDFAPTVVAAPAAPPAGTLPRTGNNEGTFAGAAAILAILGLAVRRWSRRSTLA